jgi:hypothetical protein
MVDKPRLSIDIYNQYVNDDELVQWPNDPNERALLARALLGKELIAEFDSQMRWAIDFLENSQRQEPVPRKNRISLEDDYLRENLHPLETRQKKMVRDLLRKSMVGMLFSMLVTLDQSSFGNYDLVLSPAQTIDHSSTSLFTALPDELHDELNDWIVSFSDFADEIVELVEHPKGWWQFQPKESYRS